MTGEAMRKWICIGVLSGLLEFGIIYQVAFSGPEVAPAESLRAPEKASPPKYSPAVLQAMAESRRSSEGDPEARPSGERKAGGGQRAAARASAPQASSVPGSPSAASAGPAAEDEASSLLSVASAVVTTLAAVPLVPPPVSAPVPVNPTPAEAPAAPIELPNAVPVPVAAPNPPVPPPAAHAEPVDLASLPVEDMIRQVFGPHGEKAVQVARCESTLRPWAKSGQFLGLFQMGANERADYGHGADPLAQIRAAYALFQDRGWQPWTCA